jgi:hypothetical protein
VLDSSYLRLGAFFSDASGAMTRLAGDLCESLCKSPVTVDNEVGDRVAVVFMLNGLSHRLLFLDLSGPRSRIVN